MEKFHWLMFSYSTNTCQSYGESVIKRLSCIYQYNFSFSEILSFMVCEGDTLIPGSVIAPPADCDGLLRAFNKAVDEVILCNQILDRIKNSVRVTVYVNKVLVITLYLAFLLTKLLEGPNCTEEMMDKIYRAVYNFVKLQIKNKLGRTVLHVACTTRAGLLGGCPACHFPLPPLVQILLKVGADPNAMDHQGNTPLHLVAKEKPPIVATLVQMLLDNGAHIDLVNKNGDTFASLFKGKMHAIVNTTKYVRLSCLAARVVKRFKIPYKGSIPAQLETYVANH